MAGQQIITQQPTIPVCQPADQPNYLAWRTKSARQPARFLSAPHLPLPFSTKGRATHAPASFVFPSTHLYNAQSNPTPTYNATMRAIVYISTIVISSNGVLGTDATVALSISRQENRPYRSWSKSNSSTHKLEKYTSKRSRRCINLFAPSHILTPHSPVVICFSFLFFGDKRALSVCL